MSGNGSHTHDAELDEGVNENDEDEMRRTDRLLDHSHGIVELLT